jgi:uncharacterized repeat protein (TIGR01451 family)
VVTKTDNINEVSPGDVVDYTITVANQGQFLADGVQVVDFADPRVFRFVSASDGGVYDPATGRVTWNLGTVLPGDPPRVLTLTLENGSFFNRALRSSSNFSSASFRPMRVKLLFVVGSGISRAATSICRIGSGCLAFRRAMMRSSRLRLCPGSLVRTGRTATKSWFFL